MKQEEASIHLRRLVEFVELNRAGWWDRAVARLVIEALAVADGALSLGELRDGMRRLTATHVDWPEVEAQTSALVAAGDVLRSDDDKVSLSGPARARHQTEISKVAKLEAGAQQRFVDIVGEAGFVDEDVSALWGSFCDNLIAPLVNEFGARIYEFFTSEFEEFPIPDDTEWFNANASDTVTPEGLRQGVVRFLDPANEVARGFLLRRINASFLLRAARLPPETVQLLQTQATRHRRVNVLIDTNYLVAFLGLHEDAANQAADHLLQLIAGLPATIDVRLYVLAETLEEMRVVLDGAERSLSGFSPPSHLASAAARLHQRNLTNRYYEAQRATRVPIAAADFFGRYSRNLQQLLREKSVNLFNEPHEYSQRGDFEADLVTLSHMYSNDFYRSRPDDRKNVHDLTLWYFAHGKQAAEPETPLDLGFVVASLDRTFMAFDEEKRRQGRGKYPLVIHPSLLVRLLQVSSPGAAIADEALVSAFRLPFLLLDLEGHAEATTHRLLQALAMYEGIEDLPEETILAILESEALRSQVERLSRDTPIVEVAEKVETALVDELRQSTRESAQLRAYLDLIVEKAGAEVIQSRAKSDQLDEIRAELADSVQQTSTLKELLAEATDEQETLQDRVAMLEHAEGERTSRGARRKVIRRALPLVLLLVALTGAAAWLTFDWLRTVTDSWIAAAAAGALGAQLVLIGLMQLTGLVPELAHSAIKAAISKPRRWLGWTLGTVGIGVLTNLIYDTVAR